MWAKWILSSENGVYAQYSGCSSWLATVSPLAVPCRIRGAGAALPAVEVTAEHDDFIRFGGARNLACSCHFDSALLPFS
jgi:hypothetical protein